MTAGGLGDVTALTLPQLLARRAALTPEAVALRHKEYGIWNETTYAAALERTREEIRRRAGLAAAALCALPPGEARDALQALAQREIDRAK